MDAVIKAEHLTHIYSKGTPFEKAAIRDVSVEIYPGQLVAVIGHTGSGKSTFIQHLNGLLRHEGGHAGREIQGRARVPVPGVSAL